MAMTDGENAVSGAGSHREYVDLEPYSPELQHYTCWNCGYEGLARSEKSDSAIICSECFHGQGDDGRDYLQMWYPDLPRSEAAERQNQLREEARQDYRESFGVEVRI